MINKTIKETKEKLKLILTKYICMRRKETIIGFFMDTIFFRHGKSLFIKELKQVKQTTNKNKFSFYDGGVGDSLHSFPQSTLKFYQFYLRNLCKFTESVKSSVEKVFFNLS